MLLQPPALGGRRAGDDEYRGKMVFSLGFIQERNIDEEPAPGIRGFAGEVNPALANDGVQNGFEFMTLGWVRENQLAQRSPIGLSGRGEDVLAKRGTHGPMDRRIVGQQFVRGSVGVEQFRWQVLAKGSDKCRFPRGNAASDAKRGHGPGYLLISGSSIGISVGAMVSITSSFSSSARTGSPAGVIRRAVTKMTRLRLMC